MRSLNFQRLLGSGAFGSVYLAELVGDRGFRRQTAVKVLLKENAHGDMFLSRVRDEARLLGLLQDDHILKVLELAKIDGRDAVLMEYVEGVDLAAIVEMGLRPPPRALAELGGAIAGALYRAHRAVHPSTGQPLNVIHRDVKPANVMVTDRGNVKLLDFGVARARFESRESYTGQFVLGTLNYMAPEYIVTGDVSPAADIYGLALSLWEAACGDVFGQPKLRQDLHEGRVEERLEVISGTHAELVPVLRQMLAWEPRMRPDGAQVERAFIAATDMLRGTGLRSWASEAVPRAVAREREAAKDECGFLGRSFTLEDDEPSGAALPRPAPVTAPPANATIQPAPARAPEPPPHDDSPTMGLAPHPLDGPPRFGSPGTPPRGGSPGAPRGGSPGAPRGGSPGAPRGGSPGAPRGGSPGAPRGGSPGAQGSTPGALRTASPGAPRPGSPGGARTGAAVPARRKGPANKGTSGSTLLLQGFLICGLLSVLFLMLVGVVVLIGVNI